MLEPGTVARAPRGWKLDSVSHFAKEWFGPLHEAWGEGKEVVCVFDAQGWVLSPAVAVALAGRRERALRTRTGLDGWMILLGSSFQALPGEFLWCLVKYRRTNPGAYRKMD